MLEQKYTFTESATTLFDAFVTKHITELWLFKNDTNDLIFNTTADGFSVDETDGDIKIPHWTKYIKVDRPNTLQFTLEVPAHFEGVSEVTINLKEAPNGTQLILTQKNIDTSKTEAAWKVMLERLQILLQKPYTVTIQSGGEEVIAAIMVVTMQILGFARNLDEATWNKQPFNRSWTVAQLIRHLQKAITGMDKLLSTPSEQAQRDAGLMILGFKQSFLDITKKMESPDFIVPEEKQYDKERLMNGFINALAPLNHVKNVGWNELVKGLPFGDVTKLEIIHFMLYHFQRHLMQMKRITDFFNPIFTYRGN